MKPIVGLYKTVAEANKVKSELTSQGLDSSNIRVIDQTGSSLGTSSTGSTSSATGTGESIGTKIKDFFSSFSGSENEGTSGSGSGYGHYYDDRVHNSYTQGITGGGALLAVTADDQDADRIADMLQEYGATNIEGGYNNQSYASGSTGAEDVAVLQGSTGMTGSTGNYGATGTTGSYGTTGTTAGEQVIPIVEENLVVGKRQEERGGVRIYSHVVSTPVSESVSLHDERVVVDRQAVDRPATDADFNPNPESIEVRAMGEEAVVGKRSRVVEEIRVGKEASDRTEQVTDTVRHTEVDVEPTVTETTTSVTGSTTGTTTRR